MKPLLVIDCNYLAHRARFTTGPLSYKGQPTGVIFGFLNQLFSIGKEVMPENIIFTWDSRKSKRRRILPEYKMNRKQNDEGPDQEMLDAFHQFALLRKEILPGLGFKNNWMQPGYEADDLIAVCCSPERSAVIASSDDDLLQLLSKQTCIYNLGRKEYYTKDKFVNEYGIKPKQWIEVKKIAGCSGDNVPGVPGVGEKTAIKYLRGELNPDTKTYQKIEQGRKIIERNEDLVSLPFPGTKGRLILPNVFDVGSLKSVCRQFGFTKMTNNLDDWKVVFE